MNFKNLFLTLIFVCYQICFVQPAYSSELKNEIEKILGKKIKKTGISVRDQTGTEIININGNDLFTPASIAKTVSTGCSLLQLGPQFQFKTVFGYKGTLKQGLLKGDLVIRGEGDPSLVIEDLKEAIDKLRHLYGITKIEGDLIFDVSYFGTDQIKMADGFDGDSQRSFATQLTPTPMNQNSFSVWVGIDPENKSKTVAEVFPFDVLDLKLSNQTKTKNNTAIYLDYDADKKRVSVSGGLDDEDESKAIYRAVPQNYDYYSTLIHRLWQQNGGVWENKNYKIEKKKMEFETIYTHQSRPLAKVLMDINKYSLNLGAELTLLAATANKKEQPTDYVKAIEFLNECLANQGIEKGGIILTNASGLSREAKMKPSQLTMFLNQMSQSLYAPEYVSSFSVLGLDGTTKKRLVQYPGAGRLKTGGIDGVSSITGYIYSKNKKTYTFSIIMNGVDRLDGQIKNIQDQIIEKIILF